LALEYVSGVKSAKSQRTFWTPILLANERDAAGKRFPPGGFWPNILAASFSFFVFLRPD
jgi:hypothetical protein